MAVKTTSVALGAKLTEYTRRKVESGEFGSASEERDRKIERLRQLIQEGEESGAPQTFDWDQFMESKFPDA
jgi:antitoxin ParD1/3/4